MAFIVGLTGGIGSGKSAVGAEFERLGIAVVDSDAIAHQLTAPGGAAIGPIRDAFGAESISADGAMDRARMRALAFGDPGAKHRLEKILHPLIRAESARLANAATSPYAIMMIPLLVETASENRKFDRILVVDCPEEVQVARVMSRNGMQPEQVRSIMAAQVSRAERLRHATDVIENTGTVADLVPRVAELHAKFLDLCARSGTRATAEIREGASGGNAVAARVSSGPTSEADRTEIVYEYPLTERIRTMLRLENLFGRIRHFLTLSGPLDHHVTLLTLFEIMEVSGRADLKSDLLQELEKQKQMLLSFRNNPAVEQGALDEIITEVEKALSSLFNMTGKIGQYLRENEWLMAIKQRTGIPGGACEFDLPSYHFWLHRAKEQRAADLANWITPLYPLRDGSAIVLKLLREGGKAVQHVARQGAFSQMLGGRPAQLVRIRVPRETGFIPEISANKYALNVRFTVFGTEPRPKPAVSDVPFELTFCNI